MRILLQNVRSEFYFRGGHAWTCDPQAAFDFESPEALLRFVRERDLRDVQMILLTDEPDNCESVPLSSFGDRS